MSYQYSDHRHFVFTEDGQDKLLRAIRIARESLAKSGAVLGGKFLTHLGGGDSWHMMAIVDRLVELEMLKPVRTRENLAWQDTVFIAGDVPLP